MKYDQTKFRIEMYFDIKIIGQDLQPVKCCFPANQIESLNIELKNFTLFEIIDTLINNEDDYNFILYTNI